MICATEHIQKLICRVLTVIKYNFRSYMNKQKHYIDILKVLFLILVFNLTLVSAQQFQENFNLEQSRFDSDLQYGELSILNNTDGIILNFVGDGAIPAMIVMYRFFDYIKNNVSNMGFNLYNQESAQYAAEVAIKLPQNSNLMKKMITAETPIPKGELLSISLSELNKILAPFSGRPDELRQALYLIYDDRNKVKADQIQNN